MSWRGQASPRNGAKKGRRACKEGRAVDKEGRVSAVIVGVGGFLGIGEKDVAVPFSALKVAEKNGDHYLVMNTSKEALEKAPGYTYDRTKGVWVPAKQPS